MTTHLIRHDHNVVTLLAAPRFYFAHDDGASVIVAVYNGHHEGSTNVSVEGRQVVDVRDECWSLEPRAYALINRLSKISTRQARTWHEHDVFTGVEANLLRGKHNCLCEIRSGRKCR